LFCRLFTNFLYYFNFLIGKPSGRGRAEPLIGSDEDSQHDTASIISSVSENRSVLDEGKFK
jgi:hypothetical protein